MPHHRPPTLLRLRFLISVIKKDLQDTLLVSTVATRVDEHRIFLPGEGFITSSSRAEVGEVSASFRTFDLERTLLYDMLEYVLLAFLLSTTTFSRIDLHLAFLSTSSILSSRTEVASGSYLLLFLYCFVII